MFFIIVLKSTIFPLVSYFQISPRFCTKASSEFSPVSWSGHLFITTAWQWSNVVNRWNLPQNSLLISIKRHFIAFQLLLTSFKVMWNRNLWTIFENLLRKMWKVNLIIFLQMSNLNFPQIQIHNRRFLLLFISVCVCRWIRDFTIYWLWKYY